MKHFTCEREGLKQTLGPQVLGDYDGSGLWRVFLGKLASTREQLLVEFHEGLHHELQLSSAWGVICAASAALAREGFRAAELNELVHDMVESSRITHETFATVISGLALGEAETTELLLGNELYSQYFRSGLALVARDDASNAQLYHGAIAAVLRVCMSPINAFGYLRRGFGQLCTGDVDIVRDIPDARLAAYHSLRGPHSWQRIFDELLDAHRPRFRNEIHGQPAPLPDEQSAEFTDLRAFEEEILLPSCYRHVQQLLEQEGMGSVGVGQQSKLALALKSAVHQVNKSLGERIRVVTQRRSVAQDMLEFDRQQVVLCDRLPASREMFTGSPQQLDAYRTEDPDTPHTCGVWMSRAAAAKQWDFPRLDEVPEVLIALVQGTASASGDGICFAVLPSALSPREVQTLVGGELPVVVLTTLSSLVDPVLEALLRRVSPVFVLMDLPIAWHVNHWIDQGAEVRFAVSPLTGIGTAELWLAAFMLDTIPGLVFVNIAGSAAISFLSERIRDRHDDGSLVVDPDVLRRNRAGINLAVSHIFSLWSVLDQNGTQA
jgi:hypothetical protein